MNLPFHCAALLAVLRGTCRACKPKVKIRRHRRACACLALLVCGVAHAGSTAALAELKRQLSTPDQRINYARAKLLVDRMTDPGVDESAALGELDRLVRAVQSRTPAGLSPRDRMDILLSTLYASGPWNDHRPFAYDLDDPLGKNRRSKLLSTYLRTRKGNCVSMPILVAIIGQRVGLTVTLATAPEHVLAKLADGQAWLNVEATAGGYKWDSSYERDLGIGATAIQNQIYLRPLRPREAVGVMAHTLMEEMSALKRGDDLMAVADMLLSVNPRDIVAIIQKANAYNLQLQQRYVSKFKRPSDIPASLRKDYAMRSQANLDWFAKAEALGWSVPTASSRASYLKSVEGEPNRKEKR